jgi:hypothetical protein
MTRRHLRLGLLVVWIGLVAGGILLHGCLHSGGGPGAEEVRAARALPANHRIKDADLAVDPSTRVRRSLPAVRDLLGRYLITAKRPGEAITRGEVTELPSLPIGGAGPVTVVYQLPEPYRVLADLLDVGAQVRLCAPAATMAAQPCLPNSMKVLAVHPADPGATNAWLLLSVPTADEATLHRYLTAEDRYLVVVGAAPPSAFTLPHQRSSEQP